MVTDTVQSINNLFNRKELRVLFEKLKYPIALLIFTLIIPNFNESMLLEAFIVSMVGEIIQIWSFGSLKKNEILACKGPYRIVRNPMYIGRFFVLLGIVILLDNIFMFILFMISYYFYVVNRVEREERSLRRYFGKTYESYCLAVHRFLPTLRKCRQREICYFNWNFFLENHGHLNFMVIIYCYACIYFFISL